jgi:hypothetical protein
MDNPSIPSPALVAHCTYARARLGWSRVALSDLARRWAIYLLVGLAAGGAFSVGAGDSVQALAAWAVLPLVGNVAQPWPTALGRSGLQALAGIGLVAALRPCLVPRHWGEIEAALPIAAGQRWAMDVVLSALALALLFVVYGIGMAFWLIRDPAWLQGREAMAIAWVAGTALLSLTGGATVLQQARAAWLRADSGLRPAAGRWLASRPPPASAARDQPAAATWPAVPWWQALWWWPLWRGPSPCLGRLTLLGVAALLVANALLLFRPAAVGWVLGGFAAPMWLLSTRMVSVACEDFAPLVQACDSLPLDGTRVERWARTGAVLPMLLGVALLCAQVTGGVALFRPPVLLLFAAACSGGAAWLVTRPTMGDPQERAAGWLLVLVGILALASEVQP